MESWQLEDHWVWIRALKDKKKKTKKTQAHKSKVVELNKTEYYSVQRCPEQEIKSQKNAKEPKETLMNSKKAPQGFP